MRWLVVLLLAIAHPALAQVPDSTFDFVEVQPVLIGGMEALQRGIVYPEAERQAGAQGRVIVQFVVDTSGATDSVRVARGVSPGLDSAAVTAVRMARFTPGTQQGRPVLVRFTLPVTFRIAAPRRAFAADTLLARLGGGWSLAGLPAPDSGAVASGTGRLIWNTPDRETERVVAHVVSDTLRQIDTRATYESASLASIHRLAESLEVRPGLRTDSAGFYTANVMGQDGVSFPIPRDLRFDLDSRSWSLRLPACIMRWQGHCMVVSPVLIGGIGGLEQRVRYPASARRSGIQGRVFVTGIVDAEGTPRDVRVFRGTTSTTDPDLEAEALRVYRESRFLPARAAGGDPMEMQMTLPITFQLR